MPTSYCLLGSSSAGRTGHYTPRMFLALQFIPQFSMNAHGRVSWLQGPTRECVGACQVDYGLG